MEQNKDIATRLKIKDVLQRKRRLERKLLNADSAAEQQFFDEQIKSADYEIARAYESSETNLLKKDFDQQRRGRIRGNLCPRPADIKPNPHGHTVLYQRKKNRFDISRHDLCKYSSLQSVDLKVPLITGKFLNELFACQYDKIPPIVNLVIRRALQLRQDDEGHIHTDEMFIDSLCALTGAKRYSITERIRGLKDRMKTGLDVRDPMDNLPCNKNVSRRHLAEITESIVDDFFRQHNIDPGLQFQDFLFTEMGFKHLKYAALQPAQLERVRQTGEILQYSLQFQFSTEDSATNPVIPVDSEIPINQLNHTAPKPFSTIDSSIPIPINSMIPIDQFNHMTPNPLNDYAPSVPNYPPCLYTNATPAATSASCSNFDFGIAMVPFDRNLITDQPANNVADNVNWVETQLDHDSVEKVFNEL